MFIPPRRAWALAATFLALGPLLAQESPSTAPPAPPRTEEPPAPPKASRRAELSPPAEGFDASIFDGKPIQRITLQQAIELALLNNLDVKFERLGIAATRAQVRLAAGAFDPQLFATGQYQRNKKVEDINDPSTTQAVTNQNQFILQQNSNALLLNSQITNATASLLQQSQVVSLQQQLSLDQVNQQRVAQGQAPITLPQIQNPQALQLDQSTLIQPQLNDFVLFDQRALTLQAGVQGRSSIGTRYALQATVSDSRNTFEGNLQPIHHDYESFAGLSIQQPLLKGFGKDANLLDLRSAQINAKIQTFTWKQNIATAIQNVMSAYYDMLYALNDINVRHAAIMADNSLVELYQKRVDLGFNSPFDIRQAQAAVAADQEALLNSKFTFLDRQFALKRLISKNTAQVDGHILIPADAPNLTVSKLNRRDLLLDAYRLRWDYQAQLLGADLQNVRLKFAKNQLLPQLDLIASYGVNGLGRSYGDSFDEVGSFDRPSWTAGLQFTYPLGNRQARAQYDAIADQKEQALIRVKRSELDLETDVDTVIARIQTNRQRVDASRETRELNEEAVRIGYRRLEEGQVSAYDITEQQRKLYDAKSRELAALADYNKSVTQMWLVTGTVLEREAIEFHEPVEPKKADHAMTGKTLPEAVSARTAPATAVAPGAKGRGR